MFWEILQYFMKFIIIKINNFLHQIVILHANIICNVIFVLVLKKFITVSHFVMFLLDPTSKIKWTVP